MLRVALDKWLADSACQPGLIDPVDGSSKLGHSVARLAARWGRVGDWLHSGAEDVVNLIAVPPPQRIEGSGSVGHGNNGDRGGQVMLVLLLP